MAQIILAGDGVSIEIPDEIATSDELLKRALAPHYPDLANASLTREDKDGVLRVTVSKRAGPKGSDGDSTGAGAGAGNKGQAGQVQPDREQEREREREREREQEGSTTPPLSLVARLAAAPVCINPALALAWQLARLERTRGRTGPGPAPESERGSGSGSETDLATAGSSSLGLTLEEELTLQGTITEAILAGELEAASVEKSVALLVAAPAVSAQFALKGF